MKGGIFANCISGKYPASKTYKETLGCNTQRSVSKWTFLKIHIANKHTRRRLAPLAIKDPYTHQSHNETTLHTKLKKRKMTSDVRVWRNWNPHALRGNVKWCSCHGELFGSSPKGKHRIIL